MLGPFLCIGNHARRLAGRGKNCKTLCSRIRWRTYLARCRSWRPNRCLHPACDRQRAVSARVHEQARQIRFIVLSPTTRRSSLLIRSERSTSAALMATIVCRNVLTFDPSDTIPPSTMAIDPMVAT